MFRFDETFSPRLVLQMGLENLEHGSGGDKVRDEKAEQGRPENRKYCEVFLMWKNFRKSEQPFGKGKT